MTDAQYEQIKESFPTWADTVESSCRVKVKDDKKANDYVRCYWVGYLDGLARTMLDTHQCGDAIEFVNKALERAEKECSNG